MKRMILTVLFIVSVTLYCSSSPEPGEPGAVITVQERSLLPEDLDANFERFRGDSSAVDILRDNILARELFIAHAIELGFDQSREVQRQVHERRRELLQSAWLSWELGKVIIEDGDVREFWEDLGTGVSYTALTLSDTVLMDSIALEVRNGTNLARFAIEHGMDQVVRLSEGRITVEDRMYTNVMDRDHLRDALTGDVIGPFPVPRGQRLIQVDSLWNYDPQPFEEDSAVIAMRLMAHEREARKQFIEDSLARVGNVNVNAEAMELLASRGDGTGFGAFTEEEDDIIAVSSDGGERDLYSVRMNIVNLPSQFPRSTDDAEWLTEYAERLALFDLQMAAAIAQGLDTIPETARQLEIKAFETLLDHYFENVIQPRIQPDSQLIQEVYLEVRDDNPMLESRVFNVVFMPGREMLQSAQEIMGSGGDIMAVAEQFEIFPPLLAEGEDYLSIPVTEPMVPERDRETLFTMEPGDETMVMLNDSTGLWLRLLTVSPEHIPEFSEIEGQVLRAAEQRMETEIIEGLVDSLEAAYHPYVNEEYFREFYIPAETDTGSVSADPVEEVSDAL